MPEAFEGFAARLYAFATNRISLFRDFDITIADEISKKVALGDGSGCGDRPRTSSCQDSY
jgi:hypothetical protein